jgi:eukaryotic-like serine/threonine-protein kinase
MEADPSRVEALFHEALALPPADRNAFLAAAGDEATAREVKTLLDASDDTPWFLDDPLVKSLATLDDGDLPIGTRIGDYEITALLGSGGMGHVYRARHLRLECDHAIKVLRGAGDLKADARLLAEARRAARLAHPNICTVYHVGEHNGRAYLIMELVQGVTLEQRLRGGPLPFDAARRYALEIVDALAHAHESGLIHSDLKPANIMVTRQGHVKVLDFGVARLVPGSGSGESVTWSTEHSAPIGGTLPYMPPEALRHEPVDARGDLWSLGVVLYEMVTGRAPFHGGTAFELGSSILNHAPEPFDSNAPAGVEQIVHRCLEKDVARRYQTADEVRTGLEALDRVPPPREKQRWPAWLWPAAALLAVLLSGVGWWLTAHSSSPRDRVSIAVLPMDSLSGSEDEDFADGVTEVLIGDLAQVRAIRVISRQSTLSYRGTKTSLAEIARTLGVDYVVKGTVTRAGSQVRITAQLIEPFRDELLWGKDFTRPVADVLTLQNQVAHDIAQQVAVKISPEEELRFNQIRPVRPAVAEAYIKGRSLWNIRSKRALEQAAEAFSEAIRLDPEHAQSYSGLADTYAVQASLGFVPARVAYPLASNAALTALELDPGLAEPHASLGRVKFSYEWDGQGALEEFGRALAINPNYSTARQWYAVFLATRGKTEDALREALLAKQSDPRSPIIHWNVARTHFFRADYVSALAAIASALQLDAGFPMAHVLSARVHAQLGGLDDAQRALDSIRTEDLTSESLALNAYIAALRGDGKTARSIVQRLEAGASTQYVPNYHLAKVSTALRNFDQAFAYLDRAAKEHEAQLVFIGIDPELAPLHGDPRFPPLAKLVDVDVGR